MDQRTEDAGENRNMNEEDTSVIDREKGLEELLGQAWEGFKATAQPRAITGTDPGDGKKKRILVIDANVELAQALKRNLEKTGRFVVRVVNVAQEALVAAREFMPDLILLDVAMRLANGGDVATLLRADPVLKSIPIVFITTAAKR